MSIASCRKLINLDIYPSLNLDSYILDSKIQIDNYQILRCERNRKVGGVACYVRYDLSYIEKDFSPEEIENIFFEILLPKTKP